jgi:hypothetical protein
MLVTKHLDMPSLPIESAEQLRSELMDVVRGEIRVNAELVDRIAPLSKLLKMDAHAQELQALFEDNTKDTDTRERALAALFYTRGGHAAFLALSHDERVEWSGPWLRPMLRLSHMGEDPFPPRALFALYVATPKPQRTRLVEKVVAEVKRLGYGADAVRGLLEARIDPADRALLMEVTRG